MVAFVSPPQGADEHYYNLHLACRWHTYRCLLSNEASVTEYPPIVSVNAGLKLALKGMECGRRKPERTSRSDDAVIAEVLHA